MQDTSLSLASFQGARKIGGSAWYTLFMHEQSLHGNLHITCYTKHTLTKQSISVYLLISHTAVMLSVRYIRGVLMSKMLSLWQQRLVSSHSGRWTSKGKITSFTCHIVYLEWTNGRIIFESKELSIFIATLSSFQRSVVNSMQLSHWRNRLTNRG